MNRCLKLFVSRLLQASVILALEWKKVLFRFDKYYLYAIFKRYCMLSYMNKYENKHLFSYYPQFGVVKDFSQTYIFVKTLRYSANKRATVQSLQGVLKKGHQISGIPYAQKTTKTSFGSKALRLLGSRSFLLFLCVYFQTHLTHFNYICMYYSM